jgi:hypothetical protein
MNKFTKTIYAAMLLSTIAWADVARADGEGIGTPLGSYSGGGYRVILDGRTGDYIGFDRQGRKLVIHRSPSYPADRTVEWKNKGYTYRLTGVGEPKDYAEDYQSKVDDFQSSRSSNAQPNDGQSSVIDINRT